jgi:hypothetical protein
LKNKIIYIVILSLFFPLWLSSGYKDKDKDKDKEHVYGVTITSVLRLPETVEALSKLPHKPTTRIVFDEWVDPEYYSNAIFQINKVSYIMGEMLDSYAFDDYDEKDYGKRVKAYLNYYPEKVDVWEIGNEINGPWLGSTKSVMKKISTAFDIVKMNNKKAAITFFYNAGCTEDPDYEMFNWISQHMPDKMNKKLDYVFVSYYEDDCKNGDPDWQAIFDKLHKIFPNAKLGIGECGTKNTDKCEELIKEYYKINVTTPNFIGGYFWWYFKRDCVPFTKPMWGVLSAAMKDSTNSGQK